MKIKSKFIIYLLFLHLINLILLIFVLSTHPFIFIVGELILLISFAVGVNFLIQYSRPVDLLSEGLENLKDKDFSMKLLPTGYSPFPYPSDSMKGPHLDRTG